MGIYNSELYASHCESHALPGEYCIRLTCEINARSSTRLISTLYPSYSSNLLLQKNNEFLLEQHFSRQ